MEVRLLEKVEGHICMQNYTQQFIVYMFFYTKYCWSENNELLTFTSLGRIYINQKQIALSVESNTVRKTFSRSEINKKTSINYGKSSNTESEERNHP